MRRFTLVTIATLLALATVAVAALAMEAESADIAPVAPNQGDARLAVAHLAPFAADPGTAVTVTLDSTPVLTNFEYADSTGYIAVPTGTHLVEIWPAGSTDPVITRSVTFSEDTDYTAVAIGDIVNQDLELAVLEDNNAMPAPGFAHVRIGHLAPFADVITDTWADVRLQDGTILPGFDDVPFGVVADYIPLPVAGNPYDLKITSADGSVTLIDPMPIDLVDGQIVSVFAVGDIIYQPVGAFAWPSDAVGGLLDLAASLQVAHLAPFAMDPGTAVTVTVDGAPLLPGFEFGDSTGYVPLKAGVDHLIQVFPAGSPDPAISETVNLTHAMDYSAIAIGGANSWDLELLLLKDNNTPPATGFAHVRIGHLAPFAAGTTATQADVRLQDGTILPGFDDVPFGVVADYIPLPAATYDLKITNADGSVTLIDPMPVALANGDMLSVFAVGDIVNQPVGAFAWPNGMEGALVDLAANLQVAHLAPFAPDPGTAVTITINSSHAITIPNVEFGDSTGYLPLEAGVDHEIQVLLGGTPVPDLAATVNLTHAMDFSAIAIGGANSWDLDMLLLEDNNAPPAAGKAHLRVGHLAPFAPGTTATLADVRLQNGDIVDGLDDVPFGVVADYLPLDAGTYDLKITNADGSVTLIDPMPVDLMEGDIVSVFAVGDITNQPVSAFAWASGMAGALVEQAANLQVAHLAPFGPNTAVTVTVDSTPLLPDFEFGDSTGYVPLEAGVDHLIQVFPAGSAAPAISETVNLTHAMDFSAIAIGGANGWDLDLLLLEDENTPATGTPGAAKVRIGHLAPFAATITDTVADVWVNGGVFLPDVPYLAITGYTELVPGKYELELTPGDGTLRVFGPASLMLHPDDIASVFAVGDGANESVAIFVWPNGEPGFLLRYMTYLPLVMRGYTGTVVP
jgi:hypothetical protein